MTPRRPPARAGDHERWIELLESAGALLDAVDLDGAVRAALSLGRQLLAADAGAIWRRDPASGTWGVASAVGLSDAYQASAADALAAQQAPVPERPFVIESAEAEPTFGASREARRREGTVSTLVAPVHVHGRAWGALELSYRARHRLAEGELRVAGALAALTASAIGRAELSEAQRRRQAAESEPARTALIAEASAILLRAGDVEASVVEVGRLAAAHLASTCIIELRDGAGGLRRVASVPVESPGPGPALASAVDRALRSGAAAIADDARSGDTLVQPLVAGQSTHGLMVFQRSADAPAFSSGDLALVQDVADRTALAIDGARRYAAAETANRTKDQFLAMLSHELRTPLNAMLGWAGVLQSQPLDPATVRRAVEVIERNAKLQAKLVDDLLDISRIISGRLRLDVRRVTLRPLVEAAIDAARGALESKGLALETSLADDVPPVRGDPGRLQQVVGNLLSNALKFTPAGGRIEVALRPVEGSAELRVTDTGRGINPEFLGQIFEPFQQLDSTSTRGQGGLGLGLAIARHLVVLHGGTIRAESPGDGGGASFVVRLPAAGKDAGVPEKVSALTRIARETAPSLSGIRVMVVDDEQDARELLEFVLKSAGAEVTSAASVAEALQVFDRARPMVVVSDLAMPDVDGYVLARQLRARRSPVGALALTAYARREDAERALAAGFDLHVAKPIDPGQLLEIVARLAARASAPRPAEPA